jgi:hypothetical protein
MLNGPGSSKFLGGDWSTGPAVVSPNVSKDAKLSPVVLEPVFRKACYENAESTFAGVGQLNVRRASKVLGHLIDVSSVAARVSRFSMFAA